MTSETSTFRYYLSLVLLFLPGVFFALFLVYLAEQPAHAVELPFRLPWQFVLLAVAGIIATAGGVLDWRFHRDPLKLRISKKEREAEAKALGLGGLPMFVLMVLATLSANPQYYLIPIIIVLLYTTVAICYDEFVFHIHRCGREETIYHRMLVFGNCTAWLAWMHYIYV